MTAVSRPTYFVKYHKFRGCRNVPGTGVPDHVLVLIYSLKEVILYLFSLGERNAPHAPMDARLRGHDCGHQEFPATGGVDMHNEFTAIIERDGEWYVAYCAEIPGANGQGATKDEARDSLAEAIALILEDRREDGLRGVPPDAIRETVTIA